MCQVYTYMIQLTKDRDERVKIILQDQRFLELML